MVGNVVIYGMTDTLFQPDGTLTRGQLMTILYRMAGTPETEAATPFTDVASGRYFTDAVAWAYEAGIAEGVSGTTFAPNAPVTREQLVTFLYRYVVNYLGQEPAKGGDLSIFRDAGKISDYAREAMAWATAEGFLEGYGDSTVGPRNPVTRAQMAKFLTILSKAF